MWQTMWCIHRHQKMVWGRAPTMRCPSTMSCTCLCVGVREVPSGVVASRAYALNGMLGAECTVATRNALHKVGVTQIQHGIAAQMPTCTLIRLHSL